MIMSLKSLASGAFCLLASGVFCLLLFSLLEGEPLRCDCGGGTIDADSTKEARQQTSNGTFQQLAVICSIVRDGEAYIDEWVDYHLAIGFHEIHVYDNSEANEMRQWGEERGQNVIVKHWPGTDTQRDAYADCARVNARQGRARWLAFIDIDEFLVLKKHANVIDFLEQHCETGALSVNWFIFGPNGRRVYQPLPVTLRFVYRQAGTNQHVKSFVNIQDLPLNRSEFKVTAHFPTLLKPGKQQQDTNGATFYGPFNPGGPTDVAVIHHYLTKSIKEYWYKSCVRGRADASGPMKYNHCNQTIPQDGTVYDPSAWDFLKDNAPEYAFFEELIAGQLTSSKYHHTFQ